ncbi:MAG: hypothetical protein R3224_00325 [Balneolaceae bacterium]|nr:hypothetical protein [Balneolaceae bacterium]
MKTYGILTALILTLVLSTSNVAPVQAQSIKILAGNTLNGALTGTILGGATMGLRNSEDFAPLRVGVGAGTLYGIGVGVYDLSHISKGEQFYISGTFNDGDNTTIIVLLDTFYGAAGGSIVAASFNLIANEPVVEALQYGASIGAFAGFGFGLIDAFVLADRPGDFAPEEPLPSPTSDAGGSGVFSLRTDRGGMAYQVNLLRPAVYTLTDIGRSSISVEQAPAVDLVQLKVGL